MKIRLLLALFLSAGCAIPVFAMEESTYKQKKTYEDLRRARDILETAYEHAPETPLRRHKTQISNTLTAVEEARDELPITSPKKKKQKNEPDYASNWTSFTDPNLRAFPTVHEIVKKPGITKSKMLSPETKENLTRETQELIDLYEISPHREALKSQNAQ